VSDDDKRPSNAILTFQDQDGRKWLAGAVMTPLQLLDGAEECPVAEMPDRVFVLTGFTVVKP
jgi:hypothetical protein